MMANELITEIEECGGFVALALNGERLRVRLSSRDGSRLRRPFESNQV